MLDIEFYKGKTVLVTGHTGFKGTWLCKMLLNFGAKVVGYSLEPPTTPSLYNLSNIDDKLISIIADIRDFDKLNEVFIKYQPEIVFHLAAQPLVRDSYKNPKYTYETNVLGTVNVLECIRLSSSVKSFVNITTDKVYENIEKAEKSYEENDNLNGYDPYSNSKSCSELVTSSYKKSFFDNKKCAISTVRAGNVIGGGDFSKDRIIPDAVRAILNNEKIIVRNPNSVRPYQFVLEPLYVYLMIAEKQYNNKFFASSYNVGPNDNDCVTTKELINCFCNTWGNNLEWTTNDSSGPHEANFLKLNCDKLKETFFWKPKWDFKMAVNMICDWTKVYINNIELIPSEMDRQIKLFMEG